jgi:hypothetical protein
MIPYILFRPICWVLEHNWRCDWIKRDSERIRERFCVRCYQYKIMEGVVIKL